MCAVSGIFVRIDDPADSCPTCGKPTKVEKTVRRRGVTLAHGRFEAHTTVRVCTGGCAGQDSSLRWILPPKSVVGYDVMVHVGIERFLHHRQREEIRAGLEKGYGITLSSGEISILATRFLSYLERLHQASTPALRAALAEDGGWPLHIDATGENGRGTLLVAYAGWRGWVLGAWKIPTERAEAILPRLQEVVEGFGPPCAIMRDLGRAMSEAAQSLVEQHQPSIPVLACHLHFLADIGTDLLKEDHDRLRALFRQVELSSKLRSLARDLGRGLGTTVALVRKDLRRWQDGAADRFPEGATGLALVRALAQWILDYPAEGADQGFPFDLPWLALYDRSLQVGYALKTYQEDPPADPQVQRALLRLQRILQPIEHNDPPFDPLAERLSIRSRLFTQLRQALRLEQKGPKDTPGATITELDGIRNSVEKLTHSLQIQRGNRGCSEDKGKAIKIILTHLVKHGSHLWGQVVQLPEKAGGGVRLVARTNNVLESFFHTLKHGERRRSGRKILAQDFEQLPSAAALAVNLTRPDYVALVCGTLDRLPEEFAKLDHEKAPQKSKQVEVTDPETASLSGPDRREIRSMGLADRIVSAARKAVRSKKVA